MAYNASRVYVVVFQFSYTAVFGAYTAFIFLRTGALWLDLSSCITGAQHYLLHYNKFIQQYYVRNTK